jgi:osmotically-inducible protein OsmY
MTALAAWSAIAFLGASSALAQVGSGAATGQAGAQGTGSGLSDRFQSNFQRFTSGTQDVGSVVGAAAPGITGTGTGATGAAVGRVGATGMGAAGMLGGLNSMMGMGGRMGMAGRMGMTRQQQQSMQTQAQVRTRLAVGFRYATPVITSTATRFQSRLNRCPHLNLPAPVQVTVDGDTLVLRGAVGSAHDRDLAATLAMLEPGISAVRNELTIAAPSAAPTLAPAPAPGR